MFDEEIYVLCAFLKKATRGIKTPRRLLALVEKRLGDARVIHAWKAVQ
jgi:phage-related protein